MNNEPMVMRVGTRDVFFTTTSQMDATTGRVLQTAVSPRPIDEGIVLTVTPQVSGDGIITMSISPSITERAGQATSRLGDSVPIVTARETDTLVRVREGQTVVIGGLLQERVTVDRSKVPVLGDIPLLGGLFRQDSKSKRKIELVILLTPTMMAPASVAADAAREQERLYEASRSPIGK
jgi:type II secretory pathway component GspD/PulD (secretin)